MAIAGAGASFVQLGAPGSALAGNGKGGFPPCPVDVVFVMDTSESMDDEAVALCSVISGVQSDLLALGISASTTLLGITSAPGGDFACLSDKVSTFISPNVPDDPPACCTTLGGGEDWGPATAIVADGFPWNGNPNSVRIIIPISDEGPRIGDPCNDPGQDRDVITHAIQVANANGVFVSPVTGTGASPCVITLANDLATATGGMSFQSTDPMLDLAGAIQDIVVHACVQAEPCCLPDGTCQNVDAGLCLKGGGVLIDSCENCGLPPAFGNRVDVSKKGSLVVFPLVEIKWDASGNVIQDTFLDLSNDQTDDVEVQLYFINGDPPRSPVVAGDPPMLIERAHLGWNWVDCQISLTGDQPAYWSALTGEPFGCQDFTILDPGVPPGRPDPEGPPGSRMLRGYVLAWAVNPQGHEIRWNHLKGGAVIVNYGNGYAYEYDAYSFQAVGGEEGGPTDDTPGQLNLDGVEYNLAYDQLLMNIYASGSQALSLGGAVGTIDTDLTLLPVSVDLRQETEGPVTTKVNFDIWNMNETRFSGTHRCVTCWDQALLSSYDPPNHFMLQFLQTDAGKVRLDGIASQVCNSFLESSSNAAILGVAVKLIAFSGLAGGQAASAVPLVGLGTEGAVIRWDIITKPGEVLGGSPPHALPDAHLTTSRSAAK